MRNTAIFLFLFFLYLAPLAAQNEMQFYKAFRTDRYEGGHAVIKGFHRNYVIAGVIVDRTDGEDFILANFDLQGKLLWAKNYGSYYTEQGEGVWLANTFDGGMVFGGHSWNKGRAVLVKVDKYGTILYSYAEAFGGLSTSTKGIPLEDGSTLVSGYSRSVKDSLQLSKQQLLKLDMNGNVLWRKQTEGNGWGYVCKNLTIGSGSLLSSGYTSDGVNEHAYLMKNDSIGNNLWAFRYEGAENTRIGKTLPANGCGFVAIGNVIDTLSKSKAILFIRFDESGDVVVSKKIGGSGKDVGSHISKSINGSYFIGGSTTSFSANASSNLFLLEIDSMGNVLWAKTYGDHLSQTAIENTAMFVQAADSGFVLTGIDSKRMTGNDLMFLKTEKDGNISCYSSPTTVNVVDYPLTKAVAQVVVSDVIPYFSSSNLTPSKVIFTESQSCSSTPSITCGLSANFDYQQRCGSRNSYFFDRSLLPNSTYSLQVNFGDGNSFSGDQGTGFFTHQYLKSGTYNVSFLISAGACISSISKEIDVFAPFGSHQRERQFCGPDSLDLSLPYHPFTQYTWRDSSNKILSTSNYFKVFPKDSSMYYVEAKDFRTCCVIEDSVLAIPVKNQVFTIGNDSMICAGDTIWLKITGDFLSVISWQDGSKDSGYVVTKPGAYHVTVHTNCGPRTDTVKILDARKLQKVLQDTMVCDAESFTLWAKNPAILSYSWGNGSTADSLVVDSSGRYFVTVTEEFCTYVDSADVDLHNFPMVQLPDTVRFCMGTVDTLDATTKNLSTYLWSTGAVTSFIEVDSPGSFSVQITNQCTTYITSTEVQFVQRDSNLISDTLVCDSSFFLASVGLSDTDLLWSNGAKTQETKYFSEGDFWVEATLSNNCVLRDTAKLSFRASPSKILDDTIYLCSESPTSLDVYLKGSTYLWNTGEISSGISVSAEGLYFVQVKNECGVVFDSTVALAVKPIKILKDTILCDQFSYILNASNLDADSYLWSNGKTKPVIEVQEGGIYVVNGYFGKCVVTDTAKVEFLSTPFVFLGNDTMICHDYIVNKNMDKGYRYLWHDGSTASTYIVSQSGLVSVVVSNHCGSAKDEILVEKKDCKITVPNIFTPNGDGENDEFLIAADYGSWKLYIFNRWGQLVHYSEEVANSFWDGRNQFGENCVEGIYMVVLQQTDGLEKINTTVTIQR